MRVSYHSKDVNSEVILIGRTTFAAKRKAIKMKHLFTSLALLISGVITAQYTTPNSELTVDFDYLVANSEGAVVMDGSDYLITENITVAATDTLREMNSLSIRVAQGVEVTVEGGFILSNTDGITFTWADEGNHYEGFRFEDGSIIDVEYVTFEYGGGLRVLTETFIMRNCTVSFQETLSSTGGAIGLSSGKPEIVNSHFLSNVSAAINSSANVAVAPIIENCTFQYNGTDVINKAQINLGPSGADTTIIRGNVIEGHPDNVLSGGIAVASLLGVEGHAVIEENEVFNNRYGIAVVGGNLNSLIRANIIYDNDIQNDPMLGGSGINLNANGLNYAVVSENTITGNLWGMTMQGSSTANLGDTTETNFNIGLNVFENNGNSGEIYALFNNTPNDIMAMNNCWDGLNNALTEAEAEAVISHEVDDSSLGLVTFSPLGFCGTVGMDESAEESFDVFPNPAEHQITLRSNEAIQSLSVWNTSGQLVERASFNGSGGVHHLDVSSLTSGVYLLQIETKNAVYTKRITRR